MDSQLKIFTKFDRSNLKFTFVLCAMYSGVFAQYTRELHLTSGGHIECSAFKQIFTSQMLCYLCDGDTIKPDSIRGMTDSAGYQHYFQNAFLSRTVAGKVSIYTGNVPSLEISNGAGITSGGLSVEPVFHKKKFYTFDDSIFHEFHTFRANNPLMESFKSHPYASRSYTGYRLSNVLSIAGLGTSIIPLIGGLFALTDHHAGTGVTLLITSAAGITISSVIRGIIGKRCLDRSIEIYNKS